MSNFKSLKAKVCPCGSGFIPRRIAQKHCSPTCQNHYIAIKEKVKKSKFNAKTTSYNGYNYMSKKEAGYAMELDYRVKAGDIKEWSRQHKFELMVEGVKICNYYIDFRATLNDGRIEYIEVKGFETDLWRVKWKITEATFHYLSKGENAKLILVK